MRFQENHNIEHRKHHKQEQSREMSIWSNAPFHLRLFMTIQVSHWVCNPAYLLPVQSLDKLGGLQQFRQSWPPPPSLRQKSV